MDLLYLKMIVQCYLFRLITMNTNENFACLIIEATDTTSKCVKK